MLTLRKPLVPGVAVPKSLNPGNRFQFCSASLILMDVKPGSCVIEECRNKEAKNRIRVSYNDIGQWFTPGSRCNFGSRWNLAHTQVVSNLGTRGSTDQMPVESPSSPNQGLTGIKGNQRHSSKMIKTFPFAVVSHSFSGSQSAPIPDGIGCSNPA